MTVDLLKFSTIPAAALAAYLGLALFFNVVHADAVLDQPKTNATSKSRPSDAVWAVDFVKAKPGELANYVAYCRMNWARAREEMKAAGSVLSYRMLVDESGHSEWDVILLTEYRDRAAFDAREQAYQTAIARIRLAGQGPTLVNGKGARDLADIRYSRTLSAPPLMP